MPITVFTMRGTSEPQSGTANMLTNVTRLLDASRFLTGPDFDIAYPASVGPANADLNLAGPSEDTSVAIGIQSLATAIRATPNQAGLLGYSLGAEVISRFLEAQAEGQFSDCEVVWAGFVSNPLRAAGDSIDADSSGFGINGQHGPWPGIQTWEAANPADAITSCPAYSPLRDLATGVSAFSFAELGGWSAALVTDLENKRFQPGNLGWWLHPLQTWQLYNTAAANVVGYLTGQHNTVYITDGYCQRLAEKINAL
jgi:hypothetical protein